MNKRKIIYELEHLKVRIETIKRIFCEKEHSSLWRELYMLITEIDSLIYKLEE